MFKIIIAEDDRELRQLFSHVLTKNGYTVKGVSNGQEALDAMDNDYYDLIISDIMMPVMDGYAFVRTLRDTGNTTPVLMITAKDAFDDMRQGFLSGTDDYMIKPINVNEMVLRVQALLRRAQMIGERRLVIGDTVLECDSLTVITPDESVVLPQKEFMLLYKMASYPGRIFTRQQLILLTVKEILAAVLNTLASKKTGRVMAAVWHGKLNTVLLYTVMLVHVIWGNIPPLASNLLIGACTVMMLVSAVLYSIRSIRALTNRKGGDGHVPGNLA